MPLVLMCVLTVPAQCQPSGTRETVVIRNNTLNLRALLWRPHGRRPFPAVLLNHGSGRSRQELERLGPYEQNADRLGPVFARHGYLFLFLFRRGIGLSADQGASAVDVMNSEFAARGQEGRNALQLELLERDMTDAVAGLAYLRALADVDVRRIALVGHSFGGSLTLLMAEHEPNLRALVIFSGAGLSWDRSPQLRARLLPAMPRIAAPVLFIHAANDHSVSAGKTLAAERQRLGKPHLLKIYPALGHTPEEGHDFIYLGVSRWERDVFAFLDEHMRR
ncbi:MAG TPA: prolyl oligopeptidase family serine peptidase [Bryobacteraceae bacterium]|nr:prolyl oligopeptidase family serine peptidase [Bryobacteraceae bacterium]